MFLQSTMIYCTYPGFEGDQFKDHLYSEQSSEEHVEDVHCIIEIFGLPMMLQKHTNKSIIPTKSSSCVGCCCLWNIPSFQVCLAPALVMNASTC